MSQINPLQLALGLLLLAAIGAAGCGHESVASPSLPPPAVVAATPAEPQVDAAVPAELAPEPETQQAAPTRQPPKDPSTTRAPADRTPVRPGDAEKITFDDLDVRMKEDMVYRPFMLTDRVKDLDGKRVRISGFIHGGVESRTKVKEFILLKNTECKYGPGGQADHLTQVYLPPGESTKFQIEAIKVEGTLKVEPFLGTDGNTWSIYRLDDAKVVR